MGQIATNLVGAFSGVAVREYSALTERELNAITERDVRAGCRLLVVERVVDRVMEALGMLRMHTLTAVDDYWSLSVIGVDCITRTISGARRCRLPGQPAFKLCRR